MNDSAPVPVVPLSPERVGAAARVLAEAFADDPTFAMLLSPHAPRRPKRLADFFAAEMLAVGFDNVDLVLDPDDATGVWGVAVWMPPHPSRSVGVRLRASAAMTRALGWRGAREMARFEREAGRHAPREPHWHLSDVAVSPDAQGRGAGGALLRHRLDVADAEGRRVALEATTPGSRRLYERFGFVFTGDLPAEIGGAVAMVREPVALKAAGRR